MCKKCGSIAASEWRRKLSPADRVERGKRSMLKHYYGISLEEFVAMSAAQGDACGACGGNEALCVDHDHSCCPGVRSCGKCIRGLLCGKCNHGLGNFNDNQVFLQGAIDFLEAYTQRKGISRVA
jgi:hypothetical protein